MQQSRIGELIGGKYRIVRFLATGGMGVVYEAQHEVVKRRFAVKLLRADLAERRDILARFQREAEAAGALESENVAAAIDFGIARDGTPYIVMEYLMGESLAALLAREGQLPVERAADLVAQACRGMHVAHGAGIVHRDLKPQNLFVCRREDGTDLLKVLDFGVAKLQALDELNAATRTGTVMGTASYMSPEQARGDKVIDQRADVYALGAILYELVSGKMPHPGDSHNAILHHISTQPAVPLESVRSGLPTSLLALVGGALASQPEQRPTSAESFGQALASLGRRQVWPAAVHSEDPGKGEAATPMRASGGRSGSVTPAAETSDDRRGRPASAPPVRRSRLPIALAAAVLVTLAVIVLGVRLRATPAKPASPAAEAPAPAARRVEPAAQTPPSPSSPPAATKPEPQRALTAQSGASNGGPSVEPVANRPAARHPRASSPGPKAAPEHPPSHASPTTARPAGKARLAPATFDEQNPYN
jgi:serine/threonine-protein kinase